VRPLRACLLLLVLGPGCRADEPTATRDEEPTREVEARRAEPEPTVRGDPFEGIEALRPEPWAGWPLENIDLVSDASGRTEPGLSFAAEANAFVLAIAPGEVLEVRRTEGPGDPLELVLDHGDGIESRYAPLSDALVHPGLKVTRGAAVGLARGKLLELRVTVDGVAIDPLLVLRQPLHRGSALLRELPARAE
jgi:murein DD-endopeptidase MepM/ murein hydrolase activator NlpD